MNKNTRTKKTTQEKKERSRNNPGKIKERSSSDQECSTNEQPKMNKKMPRRVEACLIVPGPAGTGRQKSYLKPIGRERTGSATKSDANSS